MIAALIGGVGVALGILLLSRGLFAPKIRLGDIDRGIALPYDTPEGSSRAGLARDRMLAFAPTEKLFGGVTDADFRIARKDPEQHTINKLLYAGVFAFIPLMVWVLSILADRPLPFAVVFVVVAAGAAFGFRFPDGQLRSVASKRREEFVAAFAAYLELASILLGAADGPEVALEKAAEQGNGWAFQEIRGALMRARTDAETRYWDALGDLGVQLNVKELREFRNAMSLAATSASVAETLSNRAKSIRSEVLRGIEEKARDDTETMDTSNNGLTLVVLLFIIFGALHWINDPGELDIDELPLGTDERDEDDSEGAPSLDPGAG